MARLLGMALELLKKLNADEWAVYGSMLNLLKLSDQAYFYTYSALAQSLAALLGVLGVFAVYRLQIQHDCVADIFNQMRAFLISIGPWIQKSEKTHQLTENELLKEVKRVAGLEEDSIVKQRADWSARAQEIPEWRSRGQELLRKLKQEQIRRENIKERALP